MYCSFYSLSCVSTWREIVLTALFSVSTNLKQFVEYLLHVIRFSTCLKHYNTFHGIIIMFLALHAKIK